MTPKDKARDLYSRLEYIVGMTTDESCSYETKECALIAVDSILHTIELLAKPEYVAFMAKDVFTLTETEYETHLTGYEVVAYWEQVKEEIKKM